MASLGDSFGTSKTQDMVLLGVLVLGGYVVYQIFQQIKGLEAGVGKAAGAVAGAVRSGAVATYKGAQVVTAPVSDALASAYEAMSFAPALNVAGNVLFPDGTMTPLSQLPIKQDTLGNVYVNPPPTYTLWQLQPSDPQGNWPAVQITDASQIGQSPPAAGGGYQNSAPTNPYTLVG